MTISTGDPGDDFGPVFAWQRNLQAAMAEVMRPMHETVAAIIEEANRPTREAVAAIIESAMPKIDYVSIFGNVLGDYKINFAEHFPKTQPARDLTPGTREALQEAFELTEELDHFRLELTPADAEGNDESRRQETIRAFQERIKLTLDRLAKAERRLREQLAKSNEVLGVYKDAIELITFTSATLVVAYAFLDRLIP